MKELDPRPYHTELAAWNEFRSKPNAAHGNKRNIDILLEYAELFTFAKTMPGEHGVNEMNRLLIRFGDVIREDELLRNAYYKAKGTAVDEGILPREKVPGYLARLDPDSVDEDKWLRHKDETGSISIVSPGIPD